MGLSLAQERVRGTPRRGLGRKGSGTRPIRGVGAAGDSDEEPNPKEWIHPLLGLGLAGGGDGGSHSKEWERPASLMGESNPWIGSDRGASRGVHSLEWDRPANVVGESNPWGGLDRHRREVGQQELPPFCASRSWRCGDGQR